MADAQEAVEFLRQSADANSLNRNEALEDLRFGFGDQWPDYAIKSRGLERPQLTINELDSYIRQICNQQRQQRPRGKASPVDSIADPKTAEVITGIGRHIELQSDADNAYDIAFEYAVRMGWGYWRVVTDYIKEDSFDQDIFIRQIDNPLTVYFDPFSNLPDGSDAEKCLITDVMPKKTFEKEYPGATSTSIVPISSGQTNWFTEHSVLLAEYFYIEKKKAKLVMLSDKSVGWEDKLPPPELLQQAGISIVGTRDSYKRAVKWRKQTGTEILDEKDLPGRWIPIVPVYGSQLIVDGRKYIYGVTRPSKDPQRMINFWQTALTESIALAPKAKWLIAEGSTEGYENDWATANISTNPTLMYRLKDLNGNDCPKPERIQPEMPPAGIIQAAMSATQNLQRVLGMFDPAIKTSNQTKSDRTINAEQQQSDQSQFHLYDNLTRSIKFTWRIILDYIPPIYDVERVARIIGDDGKPDTITVNQPVRGDNGIQTVLNNVTVGNYDVIMDVGPGYNSKRQEFTAAIAEMVKGQAGQEIWKIAGDLIFRNMDFPGADVIADRLAASNPLAQIDDKSDIPPQVQMKLKQMQKVIEQQQQQLQQAVQEIKLKTGIVQLQESEETKRELMRQHTKAHDIDNVTATKRHDTEMKALTAQNVEELKGLVQLLLKHIDTKQLDKAAEREDKQAKEKSAETEV